MCSQETNQIRMTLLTVFKHYSYVLIVLFNRVDVSLSVRKGAPKGD